MGKLRFLLALWMAKLSIPALKITGHNGTDFPGALALKLCPNFLRYMGRPKTVISVTGTNGKTTVSNMLTDILERRGLRIMSNRAGSNITSGISTALIRNCDLFGRIRKCDMAVLEVDERASGRIYPHIRPDFVVITNLFRDSIMRNAHPYFIADILSRAIPKRSKLILNADDLISAGVAPENQRVYFGIDKMDSDVSACINLIDDVRICPKCSGKLDYAFRRYHHIGRAVCRDCGFASPAAKYLARNVDITAQKMTLCEEGTSYDYPLITDSIFNVYNMVTVTAVLRELGWSHEEISKALGESTVTASRHSSESVGEVTLVRQMSKEKNALAGSRAFDYIAGREGRKELLLMMNCLGDAAHWSENSCWIYDADFEFLAHESIVQIVCTGARAEDYKLRLLMAGVDEKKIVVERDEFRAAEKLLFASGDYIYQLYGTDSMALSYKVYDHLKKLALQRSGKEDLA